MHTGSPCSAARGRRTSSGFKQPLQKCFKKLPYAFTSFVTYPVSSATPYMVPCLDIFSLSALYLNFIWHLTFDWVIFFFHQHIKKHTARCVHWSHLLHVLVEYFLWFNFSNACLHYYLVSLWLLTCMKNSFTLQRQISMQISSSLCL